MALGTRPCVSDEDESSAPRTVRPLHQQTPPLLRCYTLPNSGECPRGVGVSPLHLARAAHARRVTHLERLPHGAEGREADARHRTGLTSARAACATTKSPSTLRPVAEANMAGNPPSVPSRRGHTCLIRAAYGAAESRCSPCTASAWPPFPSRSQIPAPSQR